MGSPRFLFGLLAIGLVTIGGASACSSSSADASPPNYTGSCALLASRCHATKTALALECHELGHDGDDAKCGPRKDECLAVCPEVAEDAGADTSTDASADASDASTDMACATYCTCMTATCASQPDYPYATEAACLTACKGFEQKGLTCAATACENAKTAADKAHECGHAGSPSTCH